ncbi:MAG: UDP-N-acetylmuramate dehydrogenase [Terriglobales bacterium]
MTIQENVPLAPLTTMQVGGPARYLVEAASEDDVGGAVDFARAKGLPLFVLGGGSNLVVADSGWPGLVLKIAIGGITQHEEDSAVLFDAGGGVDWDEFVAQAVAQNCAGVECLSGIPGSVGGTPVQNVGAYGQEVSDTIESVRAFDLKANGVVILPEEACGFRYRTSVFNSTERGRYIILRVTYRLRPGGTPSLKYDDLKKHFATSGSRPSLAEVRAAVRQIRQSKGMLIVLGDADCRSAGSFFKNPVLSEAQVSDLARRASAKGLKIPSYPALDAQHKVSAAWLVEHSGFAKGFTLGAAGISQKHALALINKGAASAADIVRLEKMIQQGVEEAWGIVLEQEPVLVGFGKVPGSRISSAL